MNFALRFTHKEITAWGGMALMKRIFGYQANSWSKPLSLFANDPVIGKYRFSALVSDVDLPAEVVWRTYRGRADCENRIKALKYDFAADSFNMKDFWATEVALNTVMLAYNLMSLFRQVLLKSVVVKKGVSEPMQKREWMQGLWDQSKQFDLPVKFAVNHPP